MVINLLSIELEFTLIKGMRIQLRNTALGKSMSSNPASPGKMGWPPKVNTLLKAAFTWMYYDFQKLYHLSSITQLIWYLFKHVPGCYGNTRIGTYNYSQSSDVSNLSITSHCFHFQPPTHLQSSTATLSSERIEVHMVFLTSTFDQTFMWQIVWTMETEQIL